MPAEVVDALGHFGFSSICNVLAAIKTAKLLGLGPDDAIVTVATDGGAMYPSERAKLLAERFGGGFTDLDAAEVVRPAPRRRRHGQRHRLHRAGTAPASSTSATTRGSSSRARRSSCSSSAGARTFWRGLRRYLGVWDEMITEFNARVAIVTVALRAAGRRAVRPGAHVSTSRRRPGGGPIVIVGWRCAVCGTTVDIATPHPFTCPRATPPTATTCCTR